MRRDLARLGLSFPDGDSRLSSLDRHDESTGCAARQTMRRVDAFLDRLQFLCELSEQGDIRELQRAAERGRLVRVHRGAYYPFEGWNKLTQTERYTFRVLAAVGTNRVNPTISHVSAAVLHGAPIIGPMPTLVHMLATTAAGTRTEHGYRKHATEYPAEATELRGELRMTTLSRTLAEVAADSPFLTAVGILDWAFANHRIGPADVSQMLDRLQIRRGRRRAERAVAFADPRSGSPGESLSRVRIWEAGLPAPELQVPFRDGAGRIGVVDFWWPEHDLIGEFDGVSKYIREELTGGRDAAEVVIAEKAREDRLRALGPAVARWGWSVAWAPYALQAQLRDRGLPSSRRRIG